MAPTTCGRSPKSTANRESSVFQVCVSLHPLRYSNKHLALRGPLSLLPRYLFLSSLSYPSNRELYNASSIASEPGLGVTDRAATGDTETPVAGWLSSPQASTQVTVGVGIVVPSVTPVSTSGWG